VRIMHSTGGGPHGPDGRVRVTSLQLPRSTYRMFGELEDTERRHGYGSLSGQSGLRRAVANSEARPVVAVGDDEERRTITGNTSSSVAGSADVANHGVGDRATWRCPRRTRNRNPNKALYPTGAVVS